MSTPQTSPLLHNGQTFPQLDLPTVGGGSISLPGDLAGSFGVVLIYRGAWCPYCKGQLAQFSRAADTFEELGIKVVALLVDDEDASAGLVDKYELTFPLAHSADADAVSRPPARTRTRTRTICSPRDSSWRRTAR